MAANGEDPKHVDPVQEGGDGPMLAAPIPEAQPSGTKPNAAETPREEVPQSNVPVEESSPKAVVADELAKTSDDPPPPAPTAQSSAKDTDMEKRIEEEIERRAKVLAEARLASILADQRRASESVSASAGDPGVARDGSPSSHPKEAAELADKMRPGAVSDVTSSIKAVEGSEKAREAEKMPQQQRGATLRRDDSDGDEDDESLSDPADVTPEPSFIAGDDATLSICGGLIVVGEGATTPFRGMAITSTSDLEDYEVIVADEARQTLSSVPEPHYEVSTYATLREGGRCTAPLEPAPPGTYMSLQIGFFQASQTIVSYRPNKNTLTERDTHLPHRSLQPAVDIASESSASESSDDDGGDSHHHNEGRALYEIYDEHALRNIVGQYNVSDPILLGEATQLIKAPKVMGGVQSAHPPLVASTGKLWTVGAEVRKPLPAVSMANNGALITITITNITSPLREMHGVGIDPLRLTFAIYSSTTTKILKLSDMATLNIDGDIFFPHKSRAALTFPVHLTAYVPEEYRRTPLFLVCRVHRMATDDMESFLDLHSRPDRYKTHHVVEMKQESQQTAMQWDVWSEIGFYPAALNDRAGRLILGSNKIDRMLRAHKVLRDPELAEYMHNDLRRAGSRSFPFVIDFVVTDNSQCEIQFPLVDGRPSPEICEREMLLQNPDQLQSTPILTKYLPCAFQILNSGYFNAYINVYVLSVGAVLMIDRASLQRVPATHRTAVVHVCLKPDDSSLSDEGIPAIYGDGEALETSAVLPVLAGSKEYDVASEVKLQLPAVIPPSLHLFFTIYMGTPKRQAPTAGANHPKLIRIGHAALPIVRQGALLHYDSAALGVRPLEQCGAGYLSLLPPPQGSSTLVLSSLSRSTLHPCSNGATVLFARINEMMPIIRANDGVFEHRAPPATSDGRDDALEAHVQLVSGLQLPEVLAFIPLLLTYLLSIVSSRSAAIGMSTRRWAFKALARVVQTSNTHEVSSRLPQRRVGSNAKLTSTLGSLLRTSAGAMIYHFLTPNLHFDDVEFPADVALVEVLLCELEASSVDVIREHRIPDFLWVFLDMALRVAYIRGDEWRRRGIPRHERYPDTFYNHLTALSQAIATKVLPSAAAVTATRFALFLNNLSLVADRGRVLTAMNAFVGSLSEASHKLHLLAAARVLLESDWATTLTVPSVYYRRPRFLLSIVAGMAPAVIGAKDTRGIFVAALLTLVTGATGNRANSADVLHGTAVQLFGVLRVIADQYTAIRGAEKSSGGDDRRALAAVTIWVLHYCDETFLATQYQDMTPKTAGGLLYIVIDALAYFRGAAGSEPDNAQRRLLMQVGFVACTCAAVFLKAVPQMLRTLIDGSKGSPAALPYFLLVEALLAPQSCLDVTACGIVLLHRTIVDIFPEIASRKAVFMSGVVLLLLRVMTHPSRLLRRMATDAMLTLCTHYYGVCGSLGRLKMAMSNAVVSLSESKSRNLTDAQFFLEKQGDELCRLAAGVEARALSFPPAFGERYNDDAPTRDTPGGAPTSGVVALPLSTVPQYRPVGSRDNATRPAFADEVTTLSRNMTALFRDVLRIQVDDSLKFKEGKCRLHLQIVQGFSEQGTLKDALKWLRKLQELHRLNDDSVEAGVVLFCGAAFAFRLAELHYHLRGERAMPLRIPAATMTHVFWHDYVRVVPFVEDILPYDMAVHMAHDIATVSDDALFSLEGQIDACRYASELIAVGFHYELALQASLVGQAMARAKGDYKSLTSIFSLCQQWSNNICQSLPRTVHRYYFVWARMERESRSKSSHSTPQISEPIYRIYKVSSTFDANSFRQYVVQYITSMLGGAEGIVQLTDEMRGTVAARSKSSSRRRVSQQPNACLLTIVEVLPNPRTEGKAMDKRQFVSEFESEVLVGSEAVRQALSAQPKTAMSGPARPPSVADALNGLRLQNTLYTTQRPFPSLTTAVDVKAVDPRVRGASETMESLIRSNLQALQKAPSTAALVGVLHAVMTPLGTAPAGRLYREALKHMRGSPAIVAAISALLKAVRERLHECESLDSAVTTNEKYASVLKALTDIECAMIDM